MRPICETCETCVKAASVALGMRAMYRDFGPDIKVHVNTDASTAKAIATRKGLGKVRHMAVHLLWLQERVSLNDVVIHKILGSASPSDILTKHVSRDLLMKFTDYIALRPEAGRATECPELLADGLGMLIFPSSQLCKEKVNGVFVLKVKHQCTNSRELVRVCLNR